MNFIRLEKLSEKVEQKVRQACNWKNSALKNQFLLQKNLSVRKKHLEDFKNQIN